MLTSHWNDRYYTLYVRPVQLSLLSICIGREPDVMKKPPRHSASACFGSQISGSEILWNRQLVCRPQPHGYDGQRRPRTKTYAFPWITQKLALTLPTPRPRSHRERFPA